MRDANTLDLIGRKRFHVPKEEAAMLFLEFDTLSQQRVKREGGC